jgi:hypothetical protein
MSKKDFKGGLESLLGGSKQSNPDKQIKRRVGRPTVSQRVVEKSSQEGTKIGETRATFIVKEELLEKIKGISYWDRIQIKDLINNILEEYLKNYEKQTGKIKNRPEV